MSEAKKPQTVECPDPLEPLFTQAEGIMGPFFDQLQRSPERGELTISGVRYLLMRTDSLALELHDELKKAFGEAGARQIRYKLARACGTRDARLYHQRLGVEDPTMKLALGPVHFAHVGWARVRILPESAPSTDESYFLVYEHPFSFEAEAFIESGVKSAQPVCLMNAGYSAGWCQVSFDVELRADELECRAKGDSRCLFVMAHPKHIDRLSREYKARHGIK